MEMAKAICWITNYKAENQNCRKEELQSQFLQTSHSDYRRPVFVGDDYAIRFSEANTGSFSNVVLSLSTLRKYDHNPMVICIVRPAAVEFLMANSTFLRRISHSSHKFGTDNIRGSFLGHDIMRTYDELSNRPSNFAGLFSRHQAFTWEENIERLVANTNAIVGRDTRAHLSAREKITLLSAPERATVVLESPGWREAEQKLSRGIEQHRYEILEAAGIENVNIRWNKIEQLITGDANAHRLEDMQFNIPNLGMLVVDIKTKLLGRSSAPKAYNIDKFLELLSQEDKTFAFFFVGLDFPGDNVLGRLVSVFDQVMLEATRIQHHWAGRSSRGVTQLTGDFGRVFLPDFRARVDIERSKEWLRKLIER